VYNIEVEGDHCYRVGEQGLLVHNNSVSCECDFHPFTGWAPTRDLPELGTPGLVPLPGPNPNNLRVKKVDAPTKEKGVYLKIHYKKIKVGSTGAGDIWFSTRYRDNAPAGSAFDSGGCPIRFEIVIDASKPPPAALTARRQCPARIIWEERRQHQFDEEYTQRLVPNSVKWRSAKRPRNAVDYVIWSLCKHLFGYESVGADFGEFLRVGTAKTVPEEEPNDYD
jgi:hypothetical protein